MIKECITFGEPDLETDDCIACWKNTPEIFVNCLMAEYKQIRPRSKNEMDLENISQPA